MTERNNRPLDGVTVIDPGQVCQGPYGTFLIAVPFAMPNANKRAIAHNLKRKRGTEETVYPTLVSHLAFVYDKGIAPPRTGNRHGGLAAAPDTVYPTSNGYIAIVGIDETHGADLLAAIGRPDLVGDPCSSSKPARVAHIEDCDRLISDWTGKRTKAEAFKVFGKHKVPSAPVRDIIEVTDDQHMNERGTLQWIDHPQLGRIVVPNSPLHTHGADPMPMQRSPQLGEHDHAILSRRLGFGGSDIAGLEADGVIGASASTATETAAALQA